MIQTKIKLLALESQNLEEHGSMTSDYFFYFKKKNDGFADLTFPPFSVDKSSLPMWVQLKKYKLREYILSGTRFRYKNQAIRMSQKMYFSALLTEGKITVNNFYKISFEFFNLLLKIRFSSWLKRWFFSEWGLHFRLHVIWMAVRMIRTFFISSFRLDRTFCSVIII